MKNIFGKFFLIALATGSVLVSCKKEQNFDNSLPADTSLITTSTSNTIAIAARGSKDSLYIMHDCKGKRRDSIAFSALPSTVTTYLSTNYSGYTGVRAFTVKDTTGTLKGYVVLITYNNLPVGLEFDASGNFVKVLEQREKDDVKGDHGFHEGGRFDDRGNPGRDTVSLASIPTSILNYIKTNYPTDTLVKAFYSSRDSVYFVITKNNGLYANAFTQAGTFIKRVDLPTKGNNNFVEVDATALPSAATAYLTTTYPGYVLKKAFKEIKSGTTTSYIAVIDASGTKYAVLFDANGAFIKAKTVR